MLMKHDKYLMPWVWLAAALTIASTAYASDSERHQSSGGMDIYLGVVPSQLAAHHPDIHGTKPGKRHIYHVLVALFDSETGKRITGATVWATVTDHAMTATKKRLAPMHMDDAMSYGHSFRMDLPGRYHIMIDIRRSDGSRPVRADFIYRRPKD